MNTSDGFCLKYIIVFYVSVEFSDHEYDRTASDYFTDNMVFPKVNEPPHDKTNKMTVRPAKTQISLGICPVWSESSLCALWVAKDPSFLHADSEDSDQTGRMPRLIWVFAGRTCHFVGFVMRQLK